MIPVFKHGELMLKVALLGIWLLLLVLGLGLLLPVLVLGGIMLRLWGIFLGLGLLLLLLGLRLGLLDLALLDWLGLTEEVFQLSSVDHLLILVGLGVDLLLLGSCARVLNHHDFGLRLGRFKVAFSIGNSVAASHLCRVGDLLLGAHIEPRAGESGLARGLAAWRVGGGRGLTEPEGLALLLKSRRRRVVGPRVVVEQGPECLEGLLELVLDTLHDTGEVELDSLHLEFLLLRGQARIRVGLLPL
jgi:hypothetical protein